MQQTTESPEHYLRSEQASVIRLLQLTDCHILAGEQDCMRGMNTRASFEAVCEAAMSEDPTPDLVLATGDLTQDASVSGYRYLAGRFDALGMPVFWLPGNHDDVELMQDQLRGERISASKQVVIGDWLIILLDSTIDGESGGRLSRQQLQELELSLCRNSAQHALVCLHHQPRPVGSEWIDEIGLHNAQDFIDIIAAQGNVRGVLWGHVHQQSQQKIDGVEWMSTPSTCIQFKPGSRDFSLDDLAPGYRWLDLHADGSITSTVKRIDPSRL